MATNPEVSSQIREKIKTYSYSLIVGITALVLLSVAPLFPGGYALPIIVAIGLTIGYLREPDIALIILYLLTYFSIIYQLVGFGFFQLLATSVGVVIILAMIIPLLSFLSDRLGRVSICFVILSVALMLTRVYYLSIPLILVVTIFGGFGSARIQSANFVLLLTPLLLLNNAIYYTSVAGSASSAPIIFSQLSYLANHLRPPLGGINLFSGGLPANYLYSHALAVSDFMAARSYVVYIPLIVFGIVLVALVSVADFARTLSKELSVIEVAKNYSKILTPIIVSVITTVTFLVIMLALSQKGADVLQTGILSGGSPYLMVAGSVGIAGLMMGTELATERLERTQVAEAKLEELLSNLDSRIRAIEDEIQAISTGAPSIDLSSERKALTEQSSYAADVRTQLPTASYGSFLSWISDIENRIFPSLDVMPKMLMMRLTGGLQALSSASLTTNSRLDESRAPGPRYPSMDRPVSHEAPLEEVLQIYQQAIVSIEETTIKLFDLYVEAIGAYGVLMSLEELAPPVSPASLLESRDYVTAMKLVSEHYWLNFHIRENERYHDRLTTFLDAISKVEGASNEEDHERLAGIIRASTDTTPSSAPLMLKNVKGTIEIQRESIGRAIEEIETVRKMVSTVDPSFSNVLKLNTTGILDDMFAIQGATRRIQLNFNDAISLSKQALPILKALSEYRKLDEESLIIISQYPVALRLLRRVFAENKDVVRITDLPFQRDIATFFLKSFAASNRSYSYDEERGELTYEHDQMYQRS